MDPSDSFSSQAFGSQQAHQAPLEDEDSPLFATDDFRMWPHKQTTGHHPWLQVIPCTKRFVHHWPSCPFAHAGEKAVRRDPRLYEYTGIACPDMKKAGVCLREDRCPYAHNAFEYWLHPTRYRTQLCNAGPGCRRKVCFFAHRLEELRAPVCKPYVSPETLARASLEAIHANPHPLGAQMSLGDLGAPAQALLQPTALGPLSEAHASLQGQAPAGFASLLGTPYSDGFAAGQMAGASSALQMQLQQQAALATLGVPSQLGRASSDFSNQTGSAGFAAGYAERPSAPAADSSQAFPSSERPGDSRGLDF